MTDIDEAHRPMLEALQRVGERLDALPKFAWGKVVQVSPLLVALETSVDMNGAPLAGSAKSAVGPLTAGMSVYCIEQHRRVVVIAAPNQGVV